MSSNAPAAPVGDPGTGAVLAPSLTAAPPQLRRVAKRTTDLYLQGAAPGSLSSLEQEIGGREKLVAALLHAPAKDDLAYVIGAISDPQNDGSSLAAICASHGITVGEVLAAYREGVMAASQVRAIHHIAEGLPHVVADVMARAQPYWTDCKRCACTGTYTPEPTKKVPNPAPQPCDACTGQGKYVVYPDLARQEFAAELGGMLPKKGGGPLIDLSDRRTLNLGEGGAIGGMAQLVGAVDALLYKRRPGALEDLADGVPPVEPIDAEVVEDHPTDVARVAPVEAVSVLPRESGIRVGPLPPPGRRPRGDDD